MMQTSIQKQASAFAEDVRRGLSASPKSLQSKYFYDDEGSRLFQEIMDLPEYYLTRSEHEILETKAPEIFQAFGGPDSSFDLIELGAGDGTKTAVLADYFLKQNTDFTYIPIDISQEAIDLLTNKFAAEFPDLAINAHCGDYFRILETLGGISGRKKVILFLGSNIGNFSRTDAVAFFKRLRAAMSPVDFLIVGFDLQKDPHVILRAYDDGAGVTAAFNLNLLSRINRELGGTFDLTHFSHYALYRPNECAARSFLISRKRQSVFIDALNQTFEFGAWEPIFMEISQKYNSDMILELAEESGFNVSANFTDGREYFVDSLWSIR
jgi:L-histidine Nalpha-methyltransferase